MTDENPTAEPFAPSVEELRERNRAYAAQFFGATMSAPPARNLAVVACMDARLHVEELLGLGPGDAHIIRNAGGVITDDVIRSLTLSQRALRTREIILIHHTRCGVSTIDDEAFRSSLEAEVGFRPEWHTGAFSDAERSVRSSIAKLRATPFLPHVDHISGFVYDVDSGAIDPVDTD